MNSSIKLDKDEKGKSMYRGMIGSLLYLTASRPNIMYSCRPPHLGAISCSSFWPRVTPGLVNIGSKSWS